MKYRRTTKDLIEIIPGSLDAKEVLEMMARVSYETASTVPPWFVQPFDIPINTFSTQGDLGKIEAHQRHFWPWWKTY